MSGQTYFTKQRRTTKTQPDLEAIDLGLQGCHERRVKLLRLVCRPAVDSKAELADSQRLQVAGEGRDSVVSETGKGQR